VENVAVIRNGGYQATPSPLAFAYYIQTYLLPKAKRIPHIQLVNVAETSFDDAMLKFASPKDPAIFLPVR
jgi:hypothetical protein